MGYFMPSMEDKFQAIVNYVEEFPNLTIQFQRFSFNYVWGYWFETMKPTAITVYNKDIQTNGKKYKLSCIIVEAN